MDDARAKRGCIGIVVLVVLLVAFVWLKFFNKPQQLKQLKPDVIQGKYQNNARGLGVDVLEETPGKLTLRLYSKSDNYYNGFLMLSAPTKLNNGALPDDLYFFSVKEKPERCFKSQITIDFYRHVPDKKKKRKWDRFYIKVKRGRKYKRRTVKLVTSVTKAINIYDWIEITRDHKTGKVTGLKFHSRKPPPIEFK